MKTLGEKLDPFKITGVKPGKLDDNDAFEPITENSFPGKWKVIVFYPKDFTFVCPTEIVDYDRLNPEFEKLNAVLMIGSTDNEYCKLAWRNAHADLKKTNSWMFADTLREGREKYNYDSDERIHVAPSGLAYQLGVLAPWNGAAMRATFILDPDNTIQHITINNSRVGRNAEETLRTLEALQSEELVGCSLGESFKIKT